MKKYLALTVVAATLAGVSMSSQACYRGFILDRRCHEMTQPEFPTAYYESLLTR